MTRIVSTVTRHGKVGTPPVRRKKNRRETTHSLCFCALSNSFQICVVGIKNESPLIGLVYPDKEMLKVWVQKNKDATAREQVDVKRFRGTK